MNRFDNISKPLMWSTTILLAAIAAGCSDGSSSGPTTTITQPGSICSGTSCVNLGTAGNYAILANTGIDTDARCIGDHRKYRNRPRCHLDRHHRICADPARSESICNLRSSKRKGLRIRLCAANSDRSEHSLARHGNRIHRRCRDGASRWWTDYCLSRKRSSGRADHYTRCLYLQCRYFNYIRCHSQRLSNRCLGHTDYARTFPGCRHACTLERWCTAAECLLAGRRRCDHRIDRAV